MTDTTRMHRAYTPLGTDRVHAPSPVFEFEMKDIPCPRDPEAEGTEDGLHLEGPPDRFGYLLCDHCYIGLAWSRDWVRVGVFSGHTHLYTDATEEKYLRELHAQLNAPAIAMTRIAQDVEAGLAVVMSR